MGVKSKRYNDENVNYANLGPSRGRFGLEGQLGCSKNEIDKQKKNAVLSMPKQSLTEKKRKTPVYYKPQHDDDDDFQVNVTQF